MRRTAAISIRTFPWLKDAVERAAEDDRRPVAAFVEKLLTDHLGAAGYLPDEVARSRPRKPESKRRAGAREPANA